MACFFIVCELVPCVALLAAHRRVAGKMQVRDGERCYVSNWR